MASVDSAQFLSVGQASQRYSVSAGTIRRWVDTGKVVACVTPGGWRKVKTTDLESLLGLASEGGTDKEMNGGGVKIALLARVSSSRQGQGFDTVNGQRKEGGGESDLERQITCLRKHCQEKYGVDGVLYSDIGSGLNYDRKGFVRLLEEICAGKWSGGVVLSTFKDRVCRYGYELVELICRTHGVTLEIVNGQTEVSDEQELADDVLSIITHFSAKKHGLRSAVNNTFTLSSEAVELAKSLRDSGYPIRHIVKVLRNEGHTMTNGRGDIRPVTTWVVTRLFDSNGVESLLEVALPREENEGTSFDCFARDCLKVTGNAGDKLTAKDVRKAYLRYCEDKGVMPVSRVVVGNWFKKYATRKYLVAGFAKYEGVQLVG